MAPLLFSNSTSQGSEPSVASPQTLGPVAGVRAEAEAGAEAKLLFRGPVTTAVRSRRIAHVHFKICHTLKKKKKQQQSLIFVFIIIIFFKANYSYEGGAGAGYRKCFNFSFV